MEDIFKIPTQNIELISGGKLYKDIPSTLEVEDMVTSDEDLLYSSSSKIQDGEVFKALVKKKIKTKNINIDDLLIGDFNQLLIHLRCSGYGEKYNINTFDPDVNDYVKKEIDLSKLKIKKLGDGYDELGEFSFQLPKSGVNVKFILPTVGLGKTINTLAERREDVSTGITPYITTKFEFLINEINGNRDKSYIKKFINVMSPIDSLALKKKLNEVEPDVLLKWEFETSINKNKHESDFILGMDFFYPSDI